MSGRPQNVTSDHRLGRAADGSSFRCQRVPRPAHGGPPVRTIIRTFVMRSRWIASAAAHSTSHIARMHPVPR